MAGRVEREERDVLVYSESIPAISRIAARIFSGKLAQTAAKGFNSIGKTGPISLLVTCWERLLFSALFCTELHSGRK